MIQYKKTNCSFYILEKCSKDVVYLIKKITMEIQKQLTINKRNQLDDELTVILITNNQQVNPINEIIFTYKYQEN